MDAIIKTVGSTAWHTSVYKEKGKFDMPDTWHETKKRIFEKHKGRCFRCDKKNRLSGISIHHVLPRADGGGNNDENLVPLCHTCHDLVESKNCKSTADIYKTIDTETPAEYVNTEEKIDWHCVVYGGQKAKGRQVVSK